MVNRRNFLKIGLTGLAACLYAKIEHGKIAFANLDAVGEASVYLPIISSSSSNINRKRIYIAPDDHTDYFWSGSEQTYRQAFIEMIKYYLDLADATQSNPSEYQSRWNCDGSYWLYVYQKDRPNDFNRLINRIKDGHISAPLNALVVCLGGAPAEAVLRGMYYPGTLERQYGLKFPIAIAMENQTLPYGLVSLWRGAGAQYSWKGICNCDTQVPEAWDRQYDIYWATGPDGQKVLMKWNSALMGNMYPGGYAEARNPANSVDFVDQDAEFQRRYPYKVIGVFGKGWDDLKTLTDEFVRVAKEKTDNTRQVIVSNQIDFFQDFDRNYGAQIPSVACSFGNEWDLYCASLAEPSAQIKRSVEKMRTAEALAAIVTTKNPTFMTGREADREKAWMALGLYWEHNFGMVGPQVDLVNERIAWQKRLAGEVRSYVDKLHTDALNALGQGIQKSNTNEQFFVFNPLSWQRDGMADYPYSGATPVHVVDLSTQQEVPSQVVNIGGANYLRILAKGVPAVGYKVFEIRSGAGQTFSNAATVANGVIENELLKVTVADRGAITSLIDKTLGNREFVRVVNGRAVNDLGAGSGTLTVESQGPVSVTLKAVSSAPLAHTTRITIVREQKAVFIQNEITQNFDTTNTWGFGFEVPNPDVWHEEVGAIIRARKVSQGGHYSDRAQNSRYDWLTINHFADMSNASFGITLSNADCYFMKLGNSSVSTLDTSTPLISVLAGGRVANAGNGLPMQGGDNYFLQRFALQPHGPADIVAAMKFSLEHQNPMIAGKVQGSNAVYPKPQASFITIDNPNVVLWALKPAEDGAQAGTVVRVWNISNNVQRFSLQHREGALLSAVRLTHIETPIAKISLSNGTLADDLNPQQIKTYAISTTQILSAPEVSEEALGFPTETSIAVLPTQTPEHLTGPSAEITFVPAESTATAPSQVVNPTTPVSRPSASAQPMTDSAQSSDGKGCLFHILGIG